MPDDQSPFAENYVSGQEATSTGESAEPSTAPSVDIDERRYGLGKPYRITIRGKLIHDADEAQHE